MCMLAYRRTNTPEFINYHEKTACYAKVAKLADAPDLGSGGATRGGSSPPFRTNYIHTACRKALCAYPQRTPNHIRVLVSRARIEQHHPIRRLQEPRIHQMVVSRCGRRSF